MKNNIEITKSMKEFEEAQETIETFLRKANKEYNKVYYNDDSLRSCFIYKLEAIGVNIYCNDDGYIGIEKDEEVEK